MCMGDQDIIILEVVGERQMSDCLFCKIVNGEIPADVVAETDQVLAFRDIDPQAPTHILVIPKTHIETTLDLDQVNAGILVDMALTAKDICLTEGIAEKGYRWVMNTLEDGGQAVFHIHLHILGGRRLNWPPG